MRLEHKLPRYAKRVKPELKFLFKDDFPENINDKTIYIIGDSNQPWLIVFKCPCGCNNLIQLNLLKQAKPLWKYKITKKNKISIFPSIRRITGCKSHFVVRRSKIDWAYKRDS